MAAGLGFKTFTTGEVLTSADVNGYLMQGVLVFATEAARNAAITSPQEGQFAFTKDTNSLWYYSGVAWVASGATGDIEGVTAGTGISGGGTSGTVTITNSMATEITAKADLIVGTGNAAFDNLAVGANGTVLTADSTVSPTGLKWAAPASGSTFVGASVSNSTTQAIANNTHTAVTWDTEQFDTDAFHSTSTNTSKFTIPAGKGGKYLFNCSVRWDNNATSDRIIEIYKNGSIFCVLDVVTGNYPGYMISRTLNLVATDEVELYVYQNSGGSRTLEIGGTRGWAELLYLGA